MCARINTIFEYKRKEDFPVKLDEWVGDVFYDNLPDLGYEVREEQIYTAFQIAEAFSNKKVHLAEAGLGTGKTFAYLLPAIAYARLCGKPVIIACASTALQEQLSGPKGDIETLSKILGLEVDARMAKDLRQYVCDVRVEESKRIFDSQSDTLKNELNQWLDQTKRGERSEIPLVPDRIWKHIGWDDFMSCEMCSSRGYCKLVKAREYYRVASDLIIVDHELFFHDLWTREQRSLDGKLAILPDYSAVIFDEGHKVILPAIMQSGQRILKEDIDNMVFALEQIQGAREVFIETVSTLEEVAFDFFMHLENSSIKDGHSERFSIRNSAQLQHLADKFYQVLDQLLLELQIEQELYLESLPINLLDAYEMQIEKAMVVMKNFSRRNSEDIITWVDSLDGSLWTVPRNINLLLDKHLFQKKLPVIFTSATLSNKGDFSYFIRSLGLKDVTHSTVESSFDMEKQVVVYLPEPMQQNNQYNKETIFQRNMETLVSILKVNKGRALVLTNSMDEVKKIRKELKGTDFPFEILWEDKAERGYLIKRFREEESSVLIGADFWEGIDVPGQALTLLIIWELPFPYLDPLIEVQRKEVQKDGLNPKLTIDYPEMGLKLKQGCGRLIRTKEDKGKIVIIAPVVGMPYEKTVVGALPKGAKIKILKATNRQSDSVSS